MPTFKGKITGDNSNDSFQATYGLLLASFSELEAFIRWQVSMNLKTFHFTAKSGLITSTEAVELQDDGNFVSIVHDDWKVIKTIFSFVYPIRYNNSQPTYYTRLSPWAVFYI